ncbi:MAG: hypothetical protein Kow0067_12930 [Coriobacteriia bacterium]|nr:hypothetical protein [Anaerosomatales bacterium]
MPRAKVTSKGQVTVPVAVRSALGVETGDFLAFEVKTDYVAVRRVPRLAETLEGLRSLMPSGPPRYATEDEAVAAYVAEGEAEDLGKDVIVAESPGSTRGEHTCGC